MNAVARGHGRERVSVRRRAVVFLPNGLTLFSLFCGIYAIVKATRGEYPGASFFIVLGGGSLWILYLAMVLFGMGWFTTSPLTSGLIADLFGGLRMGTIIGVALSCHTVGTALGAYAGGLTYQLTGSYYAFFVTQGVLELVAAGCAFAIKKQKPRMAEA